MDKTIRVGIPAFISIIFFILYFVLKRSEKVTSAKSLTDCVEMNNFPVDYKTGAIDVDKGDKCTTYRDGICYHGRISENKSQINKDWSEAIPILKTGVPNLPTIQSSDQANFDGYNINDDCKKSCTMSDSNTNTCFKEEEKCKTQLSIDNLLSYGISSAFCQPYEQYSHYDILLVLAIIFAVISIIMNFFDFVKVK